MKYNEEIKKSVVAAIKAINAGTYMKDKEGKEIKTLKDIQRAFGPNPLASKRYAKAAGIEVKKIPREEFKTNKGVTAPAKVHKK